MKKAPKKAPFKRILLKLSGETLMGNQGFGIDQKACSNTAKILKDVQKEGFQVAIVIGGGNIFRGINLKNLGMERTPADQMGMLATLINGVALKEALEAIGCKATLMSALDCPKVAESYNWKKALDYLENGQVLIFVGGTGNPYFTTDTAAAMRACEIKADILLKATKVDGVFNKDPLKHSNAKKYATLTYEQYLAEKLEVMDATAIALCMNNKIPLLVFNMHTLGKCPMAHILTDKKHGTIIQD